MQQTMELRLEDGPVRVRHHPGAGRPLVLLHGASGGAETWAPVLPALAGRDVLVVDLPGRGGSPTAPKDTAEAIADWLAAVAEAAGWPPAVFVGHSFGGAVALALALAHGDRTAGVALVSSGARLRVAPPILEAVAAATEAAPFRLDAAFGPKTPEAVVEAYARASAQTPPGTALSDWRACDRFDVLDRIEQVRCPARVIYGDEDVLTPPKHQVRLVERLAQGTQVVLPGVGHMLPWEAPEGLADALRGWPGEG